MGRCAVGWNDYGARWYMADLGRWGGGATRQKGATYKLLNKSKPKDAAGFVTFNSKNHECLLDAQNQHIRRVVMSYVQKKLQKRC